MSDPNPNTTANTCKAADPIRGGCTCRCHDHGENFVGVCDHRCCTAPMTDSETTPTRDRDAATIAFFAFRYALGRRSMAPSVVVDYLRRNMAIFSEDDKAQMVREIRRSAGLPDMIGDDCDRELWLEFAKWIEESVPSRVPRRSR